MSLFNPYGPGAWMCSECSRVYIRREPPKECGSCQAFKWVIPADVRWDEDEEAKRFVREHPDGATEEQIALATRLPIATIRETIARALRTLRETLIALGWDENDVRDMLFGRHRDEWEAI